MPRGYGNYRIPLPVSATHSNKAPQQAADALYDATQQPEDAG
jgi:hypothetical protein